MNYRLPHIVVASVLLILFSCSEEVSQEDLVKAAVDIKLEQWKLAQLNSCKDIAYTRAEDL